jgi:hypothetical protein
LKQGRDVQAAFLELLNRVRILPAALITEGVGDEHKVRQVAVVGLDFDRVVTACRVRVEQDGELVGVTERPLRFDDTGRAGVRR